MRQAFVTAVDRDVLIKTTVDFGLRNPRPATTIAPPETLGRKLSNAVGILFDPARRKGLLEKAGYEGDQSFPPVTLLIADSEASPGGFQKVIAAAAVEMWKENLGVEVAVETVDLETYRQRIASDPPEMFRVIMYPLANDPQNFLMAFQTRHKNNFGRLANDEYDGLVKQAFYDTDPLTRQRTYIEIERLLTEQVTAVIPIYHAIYP